MLSGSMVALVTPFQENGSIDKKALHDLVDWHIESKTDALVIAGTTGEAPTLSMKEQFDMLTAVVDQVAKRIPVIAGTGGNATKHVIELTQQAKKAGADAALIVTPYYNKPPQNGLYEHFKSVADNVALPLILYNVPGRTACDLQPETVLRLSSLSSVIGIKEATGQLERTLDILRLCGKDFPVFSGDDASNLILIKNGAKGVISVTANVAPRKMHDFCKAALSADHSLAEKLDAELMPLHKALFLESSPIPVKWALQQMGRIPAGIRLPLLPLDTRYHAELKKVLHNAGVLGPQ